MTPKYIFVKHDVDGETGSGREDVGKAIIPRIWKSMKVTTGKTKLVNTGLHTVKGSLNINVLKVNSSDRIFKFVRH